jgi:hypothetical protein
VHSHVASLLDGAKLEMRELKARSFLLDACTSCHLLRYDLEACAIEIKDLKHQIAHSSLYSVLSPPCDACVSLQGKLFHATKENIELQQEVVYLTACLEKTILSKKMIEEDLLSRVQPSPHINWVLVLRGVRIRVRRVLPSSFPAPPTTKRKQSATKSTYKLGVGFERCENKGEKSASKFIPSSTYHKEEATIKSTKTHYPSNPKSSFNTKREVKRETPKSREEVFVCMFCGCAGHLDEFCF